MTYKIEIDRNNCIACATCYTIDPAHFESEAEGKSKVAGGKSNGRSRGSFDDSNIAGCAGSRRQLPSKRHKSHRNLTGRAPSVR